MTHEKARVNCANSPAGMEQNPINEEENRTMSILTDSDAAHQPRMPRAPRARYAQCARGFELQSVREAAGMTHEEAARRVVILWNLSNSHRNKGKAPDDLSEHELTETVPSKAREIARLERTSQDAFDRAAADSDRRAERGNAGGFHGSWRPWPALFADPIKAVTLGHVNASLNELRDALALPVGESEGARDRDVLAALRERSSSIARLVWNHAEDVEFLDHALFQELRAPKSIRDGRVDGAAGYLVRSILTQIARELHLTFPERPLLEIRGGFVA